MKPNPLRLFLRLSRPLFLLGGALNFFLGVGIARYLGIPLNWSAIALGQIWVSAMQLSTHYLNEYFDYPHDAANRHRTPFTGGSGVLGKGEGQLRPEIALYAAVFTLTAVALATYGLARLGAVNSIVHTIMLLGFAGAFFYSVPPIRLTSSGYGELTTSLLIANLVPAFGFVLQSGELHRLLAMSSFPLTLLTLASMIALEFPDYASDLKAEKRTLFVRLGWQNSIRVHHVLVLSAYLLFGLALSLGLPAAIALPPLLTLPLALLQIWYMNRIALGLKPNWTALTLNGLVFTFVSAYLMTYAFWTR
ncbi:MAG: prenyltransferase [Anaerolineales bacterium]